MTDTNSAGATASRFRGIQPASPAFLKLRWQLLRCAVLLLAGAGVALVARQLTAQAAGAEKQETGRRAALQARISRVAADAADVPRWNARYRDMLAHGYIGAERRLDWIERIAQVKEARRLIDVQYELAPQTSAAADVLPAASAGGYEFMTSTMQLQMSLLHEEDLLGFFDDLAGSVPAILRVRACNVERLASAADDGTAARLKADCRIDWITLREKP
ncbi:MAG: hypothetical protein PHY45_11540 [Rhodocyclaceae bacterium]|nr:hypothetical protein [Rhodocyclaceae bacterium]